MRNYNPQDGLNLLEEYIGKDVSVSIIDHYSTFAEIEGKLNLGQDNSRDFIFFVRNGSSKISFSFWMVTSIYEIYRTTYKKGGEKIGGHYLNITVRTRIKEYYGRTLSKTIELKDLFKERTGSHI